MHGVLSVHAPIFFLNTHTHIYLHNAFKSNEQTEDKTENEQIFSRKNAILWRFFQRNNLFFIFFKSFIFFIIFLHIAKQESSNSEYFILSVHLF